MKVTKNKPQIVAEMIPEYSRCKSFHNKARIAFYTDGKIELYSYGLLIVTYDTKTKMIKLSNPTEISATTSRHVVEFLCQVVSSEALKNPPEDLEAFAKRALKKKAVA